MKDSFLPYGRQTIEDDDIRAVTRSLQGDWLTTGPEVEAFERELAEYCGARHAVVCANGTAALHLTCLALGLGPGDRLTTSPVTFLATANCGRFVGADVVFSDVCEDTANLDPGGVEISRACASGDGKRAVFPVHFAGHPCDMEQFAELATRRGVVVVEDACHALGASYTTSTGEHVRVGSCRHSAMTVFSFHAVKHIAMGEGGAITTNDDQLYTRLLRFRNHGMVRAPAKPASRDLAVDRAGAPNPWYYEMSEIGFNYRATDFQCALGRSQLKKIDRFLERRRGIAAAYREQLATVLGDLARPLPERDNVEHAYHLFVVRVDFEALGISRSQVTEHLLAKGIGTQVHYIPVHLQPYYRNLYGTGPGDFPVAEKYYKQCLSLPMYPSMPADGVDRVVRALATALETSR